MALLRVANMLSARDGVAPRGLEGLVLFSREIGDGEGGGWTRGAGAVVCSGRRCRAAGSGAWHWERQREQRERRRRGWERTRPMIDGMMEGGGLVQKK